MQTNAVILSGPRALTLGKVGLKAPVPGDVVVRVLHSGISTGTEKLFWQGTMPPFPGMGYPLVPGYESFGEVVETCGKTGLKPGDHVFVPGANCYDGDVRGLFGGAAGTLVTQASRVARLDPAIGERGALLALAATALHALVAPGATLPDLIIGHGTLGRLLARLVLALGGPAPTVWEIDETRRAGAEGYAAVHPDDDPRRDYRAIYDASGAAGLLDTLVPRLARGGEVILCGFYTAPISFAFPPAFMKEMRLRIASEWQPADLDATRALIDDGRLSLDGLITHRTSAHDAAAAYERAFTDPACLKMILDWSDAA
ncbi:chlorophyll synthesis pathway protein BchC [Aliigemmobacter aestuarii]|uniref:Chlorophyll synthesis pathway protein BchC n=1 Tax=Aliigemmobacter aestuarii TaxID=1445661 RepID=A0A4S3MSN3_9RHOB|nr:chlorophyll synthesis pathway protein BchC [Gemmobacter aestuarii]THD85578.1 chlorophyll synthesis pathway protein BchC [Gemmobacter aestuarii]